MRREPWKLKDVVMMAILGVLFAVVYMAVFYGGTAISVALTPLGLSAFGFELIYGVWFMAATIAAYIIRKPGAAFFGETIAAVIETLLGNPFGVAHALLIGMAQGLGAEIGFAVFAYRKWNLLTVTLAGALTGLSNGLYEWVVTAGWSTLQGVVFTVCCVISGAVFGGALMWFVQKALAKTGVLDRFASGKADVVA